MKILRQVLDSIIFHATDSTPFECCGILLARDEDHLVFTSLRAENREKKNPEIRYVLGHKAHLKAVKMEIASNVRIAGYYHSHPGGCTKPSRHDAEQAVEGIVYLITATKNRLIEHTAWKWENDHFKTEHLEVND